MHRRAKGNAPHQFGDVVSAHRDPVGLDTRHGGGPYGLFVGLAHETLSFHSLENFNYRSRQFTKCIDYGCTGFTQRFNLTGVRSSATFNNRSGVTEPRAFARSLAADVCDHRFGDLLI